MQMSNDEGDKNHKEELKQHQYQTKEKWERDSQRGHVRWKEENTKYK